MDETGRLGLDCGGCGWRGRATRAKGPQADEIGGEHDVEQRLQVDRHRQEPSEATGDGAQQVPAEGESWPDALGEAQREASGGEEHRSVHERDRSQHARGRLEVEQDAGGRQNHGHEREDGAEQAREPWDRPPDHGDGGDQHHREDRGKHHRRGEPCRAPGQTHGRDRARLEQQERDAEQEHLDVDAAVARVVYRLKRHRREGTSAVSFDPLTFIERLAALVPPPRAHQLTYHGVLAPAPATSSHSSPTPSACARSLRFSAIRPSSHDPHPPARANSPTSPEPRERGKGSAQGGGLARDHGRGRDLREVSPWRSACRGRHHRARASRQSAERGRRPR
ncbi:MAG: hypothetical protein FJ294_03665 [Planctomycetes bacterium]|nr:hypothetical protein [Planctomycetota bacterium]